jgi:hypothetical protein
VVVIQRHNFILEFHEKNSEISSTNIFTKYQQINMPKVSHHFLQIVTTTHLFLVWFNCIQQFNQIFHKSVLVVST